jgi:1-acyl-sn-glycerol-3-phosphate acyltransferase
MLAPFLRLVTGVQDRWIGLSPVDGRGRAIQRVYFANHASHLDAPVVWSALPRQARPRARPVAAREYWDAGPVRRFFARGFLPVLLVDRVRADGAPPPWAPMEEALRAGDSLILFPEGTRNLTPEAGLLAFKSGLYHLARQFPTVEFVPVHLANTGRMLPKGELVPVPLVARVTFGAPVRWRADDDKERFLARARDALAALASPAPPAERS